MQKVITINLNGNAYQLDERGYERLLAYLDHAEQELAGNPDRAEILADLEQAIADKCVRVLGTHKTVVNAAEVDAILAVMGPVEGAPGGTGGRSESGAKTTAGATSGAGSGPRDGAPRRRLYLIADGAMLAGVCNGLAAYSGIDVTLVRIAFLVVTVLTKGFGILAYAALMIVIPSATTSEENAAAHGRPFNAQELVDRAKRQYADFRRADWGEWGRPWRRQWRGWRESRREGRRMRRQAAWWGPPMMPPMMPPPGYATRIGAGFLVPILSFISAAAFWTFAYIALSLLVRQEVFGESLPPDMPLWVGLLLVSVAYCAIAWPIHAMQRASYFAIAGYHHAMVAASGGLLSAGFGVLIVWAAYHTIPEVHELVQSLPLVWDGVRELTR
jgi:phage shock protein PspC (stress-responsive transcriptional regulator)